MREGRLDLLDETELRERFLQVEATARGFRERRDPLEVAPPVRVKLIRLLLPAFFILFPGMTRR